MTDVEELARLSVDCGFKIHKDLGPGLLESIYEAILAASLTKRGLLVERQKPIAIEYEGLALAEGFRADLMVDGSLIIEVKSVERLAPVHGKQLLTSQAHQSACRAAYELWCSDVPRRFEAHRQQSPGRRVFASSGEPTSGAASVTGFAKSLPADKHPAPRVKQTSVNNVVQR